jgi:hypothetical protein
MSLFPSRSAARLTVGVSTSRSAMLSGRIRNGTIRPAPEWTTAPRGAELPAMMK